MVKASNLNAAETLQEESRLPLPSVREINVENRFLRRGLEETVGDKKRYQHQEKWRPAQRLSIGDSNERKNSGGRGWVLGQSEKHLSDLGGNHGQKASN